MDPVGQEMNVRYLIVSLKLGLRVYNVDSYEGILCKSKALNILHFYQALPWRVKLMRWRRMYAEIKR